MVMVRVSQQGCWTWQEGVRPPGRQVRLLAKAVGRRLVGGCVFLPLRWEEEEAADSLLGHLNQAELVSAELPEQSLKAYNLSV